MTPPAARSRIRVIEPPDPTVHDAAVQGRLSAHLAGLTLVPVVTALAADGVLRLIHDATEVSVDSLGPRTQMAPRRLRAALRLLAASGWLEEQCAVGGRDCFYSVTPAGRVACEAAPPLFRDTAVRLGAIAELPQSFGAELDETVGEAVTELSRPAALTALAPGLEPAAWRLVREPLDGITVIAAVVTLAHAGILELLAQGPLRLLAIDDLLQALFDRLESEGWLARAGTEVRLTPSGERAVLMAPACVEVWSYLPLLLSPGIDPAAPAVPPGSPEEALNVPGRGAAFRPWSAPLDALIVDLFNRPLSQQPRGISAVACGSGAVLEHAYTVIRERTSRGRVLREHPLLLLGADQSRLAREMTARTLRRANVPRFHVTPLGAGDPAAMAEDAARHRIHLRDLLHLRMFVGACAEEEEEEALARSLASWLPYAGRFGLAVMERHPMPPGPARERDRMAAAAYDAVFGFASRTLPGAEALEEAARRAGLDRHPRFRAQFPELTAPAVTFGYFTATGRGHA